MLKLYEDQEEAIEQLRRGFAAGKKSQILYAPTGAGKTEMAIALLKATKDKNNKAAMILDRIVLVDQTSKRLDRYRIDHGVMQAGHWRYRPYENIQICSAQTLERRGEFPGLNLLIIDECHQTRSATIEFIKNNPDIRVIGLTATPFTKGLSQIYDNVVCATTTKKLVTNERLVQPRVFISKEINMEGAKKVAGEWSQDEATKRGMEITGDIVEEWQKKTMDIFGKPEKTIVFCAGVSHGADLAQKFQAQGYNFICISYLDDEQFKKDVIDDFAKPDTEITGLIACDILTKGFDVPDVKIGVSARPFSKSLSSHIQQMGRIMRGSDGKDVALWLDHSGNYLRFRAEWDLIYENGVDELEDSKEKAKKEPSEKEKKESKCPACSALWPAGSDTCHNCGFVRERRSGIVEKPGRLEELSGAMAKENKQEFWSQLQWYVKHTGKKPGWAAHTYKEKFGVWPRNLHDVEMPPSPQVVDYIAKKTKNYVRKLSYAKRRLG